MDNNLSLAIGVIGGLFLAGCIITIAHYRCMQPKMTAIKRIAEAKLKKAIIKIEDNYLSREEREDQLRMRLDAWQENKIRDLKSSYLTLIAEHKGKVAGLRGINLGAKNHFVATIDSASSFYRPRTPLVPAERADRSQNRTPDSHKRSGAVELKPTQQFRSNDPYSNQTSTGNLAVKPQRGNSR